MTTITPTVDPHAPPRALVLEYERSLRYQNPHAGDGDIDAAVATWVADQTEHRRRQAEAAAANAEKQRLASLCRCCGERRAHQRTLQGPESLREQIWHGRGVTVWLCPSCYDAVNYALGRKTYDTNPKKFDAYLDTIVKRG